MDNINLLSAITASLAAGEEILRIYNDPKSDFQIECKADNSPLTIADKCANNIIIKQLSTLSYPIISEEISAEDYSVRKSWSNLWIIDPLDGTKEFIKRNGDFTVNIAFVECGTPTIGVIYLPVSDTLYFGDKTLGAYRTDNISQKNFLSVSDLLLQSKKMPFIEKTKFTVVASRSHLSPKTSSYIENLKISHPDIDIISRGSSIKICLIAEGSADVYPRFAPTMEWDTAAGDAIARTSGKMIYLTDEKTEMTYNKEDLHNPYFIVK